MPVAAVVFDIGGVLEIIDDSVFPEPWCTRHRIPRERFDAAFALPRDPVVGEMTQPEVLDHLQRELGLTDAQVVYSHEVGLKKPDPRIDELTASRLGVAADQIAFLDDWLPAVEAARAAGWHAVHHADTPTSIAALEGLLTL